MPRYFFDVHDGIETTDDFGLDCLDLEAARARALKIASDYSTMPGMLTERGGAVVVTVRDHARAQPLKVRLAFTVTTG